MLRLLAFICSAALSTVATPAQQETARHTGVDGQGNPTLIEFTATYDGKDHPLQGYAKRDSIAMNLQWCLTSDSSPAW